MASGKCKRREARKEGEEDLPEQMPDPIPEPVPLCHYSHIDQLVERFDQWEACFDSFKAQQYQFHTRVHKIAFKPAQDRVAQDLIVVGDDALTLIRTQTTVDGVAVIVAGERFAAAAIASMPCLIARAAVGVAINVTREAFASRACATMPN
ncbi:hypothetical protein M5K25_027630 [Dendrobium thyrsiflorum]|uniref:Uncharacterized protein n=1 Tax=Dendrobium thyrsiflorum TaxID=117978 RepID=A0ABD0TUC2_DENTH